MTQEFATKIEWNASMKYEILSSLRSPSSIEAMKILQSHVQDALDAGGQLVGGVSVVHGAPTGDSNVPGYEAFQAVLMPTRD